MDLTTPFYALDIKGNVWAISPAILLAEYTEGMEELDSAWDAGAITRKTLFDYLCDNDRSFYNYWVLINTKRPEPIIEEILGDVGFRCFGDS